VAVAATVGTVAIVDRHRRSLERVSSATQDGRDVLEAPVGIPVDMTGCTAETDNSGAGDGVSTPAPPGPLSGWPSRIPRP